MLKYLFFTIFILAVQCQLWAREVSGFVQSGGHQLPGVLTCAEIVRYDTGSKNYPKYPDQQKMITHIPLVSDLIDSVENYVAAHQLSPVFYNIEIKSDEKPEGKKRIPDYKTFTDRAVAVLLSKKLDERLLVQCFDTRTLNYLFVTCHLKIVYIFVTFGINFSM